MKKGMLAFIGMILALVLILVAFFGSWYSVSVMGIDANYYLTKAEAAGMTVEYDEIAAQMGDAKDVFSNTYYLTIVTLIFCALAFVMILLYSFMNMDKMKNIGMILGILTFIIGLVAAIYFMTGGNPESGDFWNELGGPGLGWYLMLVGSIIALVSSIFLFIEKPNMSAPQ